MSKKKILVCARGKRCPRKGSLELLELFRQTTDRDTKVVASKCLGMCNNAPAVVAMPGKRKFKKVSSADVRTIVADDSKPSSGKKKKKRNKSKKRKK